MIGEALAMACSDPAVLARIGGRIGDAARETLAELVALAPLDRRKIRAKIAAAARAPVPTGIRGVHASWIEAGLVGMPPRARAALASGSADPVDIWLVRWACAELPPLPAVDPTRRTARSIDDAIRLTGDALAEWLAQLGADQLAHALRKAGFDAITEIATRLVGDRLFAAVARLDAPPRRTGSGPVRAAIVRCGIGGGQGHPIDQLGDVDDHLLVRIGARAIAPYVDGLARRQLAVRLPRPLGLVVRDELRAHADTPVDQCPTWPALAATW